MVILIVDDEDGIRNSLRSVLKKRYELILCEDGDIALKELEKKAIDLVISDVQMPKLSGIDLLRKGKELSPETSFLIMTAFGSVEQAVEVIRLGADDYVMKPFDLTDIQHRINRIADLRSWKSETELKHTDEQGDTRLLGTSATIRAAKEFIHKVAEVDSPVLVLGPTGTGKEVIAKAIHESGPRGVRPFVAINCASLSEQLMESELFGHEKGAFTGAVTAKPGKFELAQGGTIFLDEVGELPPSLQAKLLRVLQEKEFYRVGGVRQIKADVRVIAATNRNLREMSKLGQFREDLFFRLNVLNFEMTALSERPEDIPVLIQHFWRKLTLEFGRELKLTQASLRCLSSYTYPGNVRELQNILERLIVLGGRKGDIDVPALPAEIRTGINATPSSGSAAPAPQEEVYTRGLDCVLEQYEAQYLFQAMEDSSHHQAKAAELLKLSRPTLQYKLKKYGYKNPKDREAA